MNSSPNATVRALTLVIVVAMATIGGFAAAGLWLRFNAAPIDALRAGGATFGAIVFMALASLAYLHH